jgi:hypothetical protein
MFTAQLLSNRVFLKLTRNQVPIFVSSIQNNIPLCSCYSATSNSGSNNNNEKKPPRMRRINWAASNNLDPNSLRDDTSTSSYYYDSEARNASSHHVLRPIPVQDFDEFEKASNAFLDTLLEALQPMEVYNDFFELSVSKNTGDQGQLLWELTINLKPGDGTYRLSVDRIACNLLMSSPISGAYTYVLCQNSGEWVGEDDGHSLVGLLVRDLCRQCNGYPNF